MKMNGYYTHISQRSYDAYVNDRRNLDQVLCALIVDPDDAADAAKEYGLDLPHSLDDFQSYSLKFVEMMKQTIAQWVMTKDRANHAVEVSTKWNHRLGVWCACTVSKQVLRYVPPNDTMPTRAVQAAEEWVQHKSTVDDVRRAADRAMESAMYYTDINVYRACYSAYAAAYSVFAENPGYEAALSVVSASRVTPDAKEEILGEAGYGNLLSLREVVANACLSFPG